MGLLQSNQLFRWLAILCQLDYTLHFEQFDQVLGGTRQVGKSHLPLFSWWSDANHHIVVFLSLGKLTKPS